MAEESKQKQVKRRKNTAEVNKLNQEVVQNAEELHKITPKPVETRGQRVCRFIETYLRAPDGMFVGQPIRLDDFQRKFILDVYDNPAGTELAILSIARKNAKTAIIACLVIVHLVGPEAKLNSEIVSGALSRDQAGKVFNYALKMVKFSPRLKGIVKAVPSQKKLIGLPLNTSYQATAAEAATAMGGSPLVLILDETGQIKGPQDAFVDAMMTSQGAHDNPLAFVISTQAENDNDLLSIIIDDARRSKDPRTVCHVYEAKKKCDVMDEQAWKDSNPALGTFRSRDDMLKMAKRAKRMPSFENSFRNLYLNQRVASTSPFMSLDTWEACGDHPPPPIEQCEMFFGGLDLSERKDLTAFILIGLFEGRWFAYCFFWTPAETLAERAKSDRQPYVLWVEQGFIRTTPGPTVDYAHVCSEIGEIIDGLPVQAIAYDRWKIADFRRECERIGLTLPLIEWGQGFKDMGYAIEMAEEMFLKAEIQHGMNPVLTMCSANAKVVKDPAGLRKLDKSKSTGRIDGMQALVMAAGIAKRSLVVEDNFDDFVNAPLIAR